VKCCDSAHDRQPESCAGSGLTEPDKGIENPLAISLCNARAIVIDDDFDAVC
jgi:hypothetical protein